MRKKVGLIKRIFTLLLVVLMSINCFAAIVSDNDGSAFITKSEFDALKSSFQSQIDSYNNSIDSKIDGAIASYLSGIKIAKSKTLDNNADLINGLNFKSKLWAPAWISGDYSGAVFFNTDCTDWNSSRGKYLYTSMLGVGINNHWQMSSHWSSTDGYFMCNEIANFMEPRTRTSAKGQDYQVKCPMGLDIKDCPVCKRIYRFVTGLPNATQDELEYSVQDTQGRFPRGYAFGAENHSYGENKSVMVTFPAYGFIVGSKFESPIVNLIRSCLVCSATINGKLCAGWFGRGRLDANVSNFYLNVTAWGGKLLIQGNGVDENKQYYLRKH